MKKDTKNKAPNLRMLINKSRIEKKNIPHLYLILTALLINIIAIVTVVIILNKLPPQIPLFYGLPRGERQLTTPPSLILPLALGSLFIAVNAIVANFTKSSFLKNTLVFVALFSSLLSVVTIIKIVTLVINL